MEKELLEKLVKQYNEQKLSHAFLIETNNIEKAGGFIKNFIKKINNSDEISMLIDNNNLPSLIEVKTIDKIIKKEDIEQIKEAFSLMPVYTKENYYIICGAEKMNNTAFNRLLKFLEEPEDGIIGFLICENKQNVAQTIVSRCENLKIMYETNIEKDSIFDAAMEYINTIESSKKNIVWYNINEIKNVVEDKGVLTTLFKDIYYIYEDAFKNPSKYSFSSNVEKLQIIKKYLDELNFNVNSDLLLNSFGLEFGELNEK